MACKAEWRGRGLQKEVLAEGNFARLESTWPWLAKRGTGHENKKAHIAADFFRLVSSVLPYFERRSLSLECDVSHISDDKNSQKKRLNKSFSGKILNVLPR